MSRVVLRISGRADGDETTLIRKVFRMYSRYAESQGWKMESKATGESGDGPLKEVVAEISGENVYSKLKYESGVHRVQWVLPMERQGRVFTSKLLVAVAPEGAPLDGTGASVDSKTIRTYNFPLDRLTDHRIGQTFHELHLVLDGRLDPIIRALAERDGGAADA
jgi:protein subunit release factor A